MGWRPVVIPRLTRVARDDDSVEVVVGRIGKPHGLRGEVTVEVRTDEPRRRYVVGSTLAAQPPRGSASGLTALEITALRWHGSALLREALALARRRGARSLFLEVRPSNFAAQALYARFGLRRMGLRRGYYPAQVGREDALVYTVVL